MLALFFVGNDLSGNVPYLDLDLHGRRRGMGSSVRRFFTLVDGQWKLNNLFLEFGLSQLLRLFTLEAIHHLRTLELVNQARREIYAKQYAQHDGQVFIEPGISIFTFRPPRARREKTAWAITDALLATMGKKVHDWKAGFLLVTATAAFQVNPDVENRGQVQRTLDILVH